MFFFALSLKMIKQMNDDDGSTFKCILINLAITILSGIKIIIQKVPHPSNRPRIFIGFWCVCYCMVLGSLCSKISALANVCMCLIAFFSCVRMISESGGWEGTGGGGKENIIAKTVVDRVRCVSYFRIVSATYFIYIIVLLLCCSCVIAYW